MEAVEEEYDQISQRTREWGERREEDFTNPQFFEWLLKHSFALGQRLHLFPKHVEGIVKLGSQLSLCLLCYEVIPIMNVLCQSQVRHYLPHLVTRVEREYKERGSTEKKREMGEGKGRRGRGEGEEKAEEGGGGESEGVEEREDEEEEEGRREWRRGGENRGGRRRERRM